MFTLCGAKLNIYNYMFNARAFASTCPFKHKAETFFAAYYFFPIGNLFECLSQGADVGLKEDGTFRYPSYVQDIMGYV